MLGWTSASQIYEFKQLYRVLTFHWWNLKLSTCQFPLHHNGGVLAIQICLLYWNLSISLSVVSCGWRAWSLMNIFTLTSQFLERFWCNNVIRGQSILLTRRVVWLVSYPYMSTFSYLLVMQWFLPFKIYIVKIHNLYKPAAETYFLTKMLLNTT